MAITKKDKDLSRAERKIRKRKLEQAIPDLPGDVDIDAAEIRNASSPTVEGGANSFKKRRLENTSQLGTDFPPRTEHRVQSEYNNGQKQGEKSSGKASNFEHDGEPRPKKLESLDGKNEREEPENLVSSATLRGDDQVAKKSKKERKAQRRVSEAAQLAIKLKPEPHLIDDAPVVDGEESSPSRSKKNNRNREKKRKASSGNEVMKRAGDKAPRFIVFVGNLPFSATRESLQKHFAAVHPKSIRNLTKKDEPEKSKGCAFLEFEGYDHMKACLKSFHHSMFDDGISPARKINVELTVGGGGNKQNRHTKITEKNQKLNEQRVRRMHEVEKVKLEKRDLAIDHSDVHPSRRTRVPDVS